jgi:hypothetical protein
MFIAVVDKSNLVTSEEAYDMALLADHQVRFHAAPAYGILPPTVRYLQDESLAPPGSAVLGIFDDADQAGALGWHTEGVGGTVYGRVFAKPVLDNGGTVLSSALSVSSVLSHEVLETVGDPSCNRWADTGRGRAIACEWCDPVESDSYSVTVGNVTGTVSDFVLPAWFDPSAPADAHFDWLNLVNDPFDVRDSGYVIVMVEGQVSTHFGAQYPSWRKETKASDLARTAQRLQQGG